MTTTEPQGLMFACITVGDTPAAETAVCVEHREGFAPAPRHGDVEDLTLQDCSAVGTLLCTVCGRDADEVAERAGRALYAAEGWDGWDALPERLRTMWRQQAATGTSDGAERFARLHQRSGS